MLKELMDGERIRLTRRAGREHERHPMLVLPHSPGPNGLNRNEEPKKSKFSAALALTTSTMPFWQTH